MVAVPTAAAQVLMGLFYMQAVQAAPIGLAADRVQVERLLAAMEQAAQTAAAAGALEARLLGHIRPAAPVKIPFGRTASLALVTAPEAVLVDTQTYRHR